MDKIVGAIEAFEGDSSSLSELHQQRAQALDYYLRSPMGNEVEGRSQVVTGDVYETVEWTLPSLLRVFAGSDDIVSFDPFGPEDEEAAKQETDYVNYIVTQKNNWFLEAYVWFKDALLQKNGYVKAWWDDSIDVTIEKYQGLTDDQIALIQQDATVSITEDEPYIDQQAMLIATQQYQMAMRQWQQACQMAQIQQQPYPQQPQPPQPQMLHNITLKRNTPKNVARFKCIAPERTLVSVKTESVDLENCPFFELWEYKTLSELKTEGFSLDNLGADDSDAASALEEAARDVYNESTVFHTDDGLNDPSLKTYKVRECWINFDEDGDGIAELRHVIVVGQTLLLNEEAEFIPIAAVTPNIMSHRHYGQSLADSVMDLQRIRTAMLRGFLDNTYLATNGRYGVNSDQVNLDDMLTSRPGGIVRVKGDPNAAISNLTHAFNPAPVLQGIQYLDTVEERRTGITQNSQGLDPSTLNKGQGGLAMLQGAAQQRIELIARIFAETGVKRLFRIIHSITLQNATKDEKVKLRGKWVDINPREWKTRYDMTVTVALGNGNKDQQVAHLMAVSQAQQAAVAAGGMGLLITPQNIYNTQAEILKALGYKNPEKYWKDPGDQMPPPPQPDPIKVQELQVKQAQVQNDTFDNQTKRMQAESNIKLAAANAMNDNDQNAKDRAADLTKELLWLKAHNDTKPSTTVQFDAGEKLDQTLQTVKDTAAVGMQNHAEHANIMREAAGHMANAANSINHAVQTMHAPRKVIRDGKGKITGIHIDTGNG